MTDRRRGLTLNDRLNCIFSEVLRGTYGECVPSYARIYAVNKCISDRLLNISRKLSVNKNTRVFVYILRRLSKSAPDYGYP